MHKIKDLKSRGLKKYFKVIGVILIALLGFSTLFLKNSDETLASSSDCKVISSSDNETKYVYVDADYSGEEKGYSSKPYNTIQEAIDRAEKVCRDVYIREGYYKENEITLKDGIKIYAAGKDKVTIDADDEDKTVFYLEDDTKIHDVTIKGGEYGVYVKEDAEVTIYNVIVKDNDRDGIRVEEADKLKDSQKVNILKSEIYDNDWNGIFMEKRKFYIDETIIRDNDHDGIYIERGSRGTIEDSEFKENEGVGMQLTIDESWISIQDSKIKKNEKSGIEIRYASDDGYIEIKDDTKIYDNDKYGIVRLIEDHDVDEDEWDDSVKIRSSVDIYDNHDGDQSHLIKI
jgi:hypothetical protein